MKSQPIIKLILGIGLITCLFSACTVYIPQPAMIPLMEHKNQLKLSGSISMLPAVSATACYSPLKHISVLAYGLEAPDQIRYFQGALGYYWKPSNYTLEIYGGYGSGGGSMSRNANPGNLSGNYDTYFLQFNAGQTITTTKFYEYGISIKSGILKSHITDYGYYEMNDLDPVISNNSYLMFEPAAFVRFGKGKLRTGLQLNGATFISLSSDQRQLPYRPLTLALSINYKLN